MRVVGLTLGLFGRVASDSAVRNRSQPLVVLFLAIVTSLLFFSLRSASQDFDSLTNALSAKTGDGMFHPHHMLFVPLLHLFHIVLSQICRTCDTIFSAQVLNILWAMVTVPSMFVVVRKLLGSSLAGLSAAFFLLVAQGFWVYSTRVDVYVPGLGCLALLLVVVLTRRSAEIATGRMIVIALLLALSVFFHQSNVLFAIPLGFYLIAGGGRHGYKAALTVLPLAGILVLSGYVLAFLSASEDKNLTGFIQFGLTYTNPPYNPSWGTFDNVSPGGLDLLLRAQLWNFIAFPGRFEIVIFPVFVSAFIALFAWNLFQTIRRASYASFRGLLLIWVVTYLLFFLWWLPGLEKLYIVTLFPIITLAFLMLKDIVGIPWFLGSQKLVASGVIVLAGLFLVANLIYAIMPLNASKGRDYSKASTLAALAPDECTIVTTGGVLNHLLYYFSRSPKLVDFTLGEFYRDELLNDAKREYVVAEEECLIIRLEYLLPDYTVSGQNGYDRPSQWLDFVSLMFDLQYDSTQRLVGAREFEVINSNGTRYVLTLPSTMQVKTFRQLLTLLDDQVGPDSAGNLNPFQTWLSTADTGL